MIKSQFRSAALQEAPAVIDDDIAAIIEIIARDPVNFGIDLHRINLYSRLPQLAGDDPRPEADNQCAGRVFVVEAAEIDQPVREVVSRPARGQIDAPLIEAVDDHETVGVFQPDDTDFAIRGFALVEQGKCSPVAVLRGNALLVRGHRETEQQATDDQGRYAWSRTQDSHRNQHQQRRGDKTGHQREIQKQPDGGQRADQAAHGGNRIDAPGRDADLPAGPGGESADQRRRYLAEEKQRRSDQRYGRNSRAGERGKIDGLRDQRQAGIGNERAQHGADSGGAAGDSNSTRSIRAVTAKGIARGKRQHRGGDDDGPDRDGSAEHRRQDPRHAQFHHHDGRTGECRQQQCGNPDPAAWRPGMFLDMLHVR